MKTTSPIRQNNASIFFLMEEIMKIKRIIIRDFEEIMAELKKVLSKMRTNFLGDDHLATE